MRKFISFGAIAGLAVLVFAQVRGTDMLTGFAKALNSANTVSATYTIQKVGGSSDAYSIELSKPDKARIDTPTQLIVADGKNIITYDKAEKTYFKMPETQGDLKAILGRDVFGIFGAFFDADYYAKVASAKSLGSKIRKGVAYDVVEASMDAKGRKTASFYLDPKDKVARAAEFTYVDGTAKDTMILLTKDFTLNGATSQNAFAFSAPADSREVTLDELNADKWFTTWADASAASKRTGKPIFIDFYTDWCHWCKVLDANVYPSETFKKEAKNWILLKIDAEKGEGVGLASTYGVNAYPTIKYVKGDGTAIGGFEGYMEADKVVANMMSGRGH